MEFETLIVKIKESPSIPHAFFMLAAEMPEAPVFLYPRLLGAEDSKTWITETYAEVAEKVKKVANALRRLGVKKGDKVALISYNRPEWLIADLAILSLGAVVVSVYHSLNVEEMGYVLFDSGASVIFAENEEQIKKLSQLLLNGVEVPAVEDRPGQLEKLKFDAIIAFEECSSDLTLSYFNELISQESNDTIPESVDTITPTSLATLVYTSGTTGPPKGVMQSHKNHLSNVWQAASSRLFAPQGSLFLFLPLAHSFARLIGYIGLLTPAQLKLPSVADKKKSLLQASLVMREMREASPEVVPTVPRILEKMMEGIVQRTQEKGIKGWLVKKTLSVGQAIYHHKKEGTEPGIITSIWYQGLSPIRDLIKKQLFGNHFSHAVSGGAKLPENVARFFAGIGIDIYEGYGLTETCVATNVNPLGRNKIGSVGPVFPEIEIAILEDGEILFKGPNIAMGYYQRPQATKASFDEKGWFHTGDIGRLDDDGYLFITGRKKDLIVTSGGKNIAPQPIEEKLSSSSLISYAVLYGEGKPYCTALLLISLEEVQKIIKGQELSSENDIITHDEVKKLLSREVEKVNQHLSQYERVKNFIATSFVPTVENGLLTPTFKLRKPLVIAKFRDELEGMYNHSS